MSQRAWLSALLFVFTWQDWEAGKAFPQPRWRPALDGFMALEPHVEAVA